MTSGTISYDKITSHYTNQDSGSLDSSTGRFTAPVTGIYSITHSLRNANNEHEDHATIVYLKTSSNINESKHKTHYFDGKGTVQDQGGRTTVMELFKGSTVELYCSNCSPSKLHE